MFAFSKRMPIRIIVFAMAVFAVFMYFNFRSHYDPLWHKEVGISDVKPKGASSNAISSTTQLPKTLIEGVHYVADYNVSNPTPYTDPPGAVPGPRKLHYFPCEPPTCFVVSHYPRIAYFPRFMTDDECDKLVDEARTKMARSEVALYKDHKEGEAPVQEVRTSTQAWLDPSYSPTVAAIRQRLSLLTGLADGELLQILHYDVGQKYDAHNDYFDPIFYGPQSTNRAITNFLYLNTVEEGGETWFPRANNGPQPRDYVSCDCGLRIKPIKGSMALFYDMKDSGVLDPLSLHGACPVKKGEKWGGTQWLRVPTP
jgi:prolyl 4-hydroxylase